MIPDFPHNIKIRLAPLKKKMLHPDFATSGHNKKVFDGANLIFHYEESLVSSNLNSKLLRFDSVRHIVCMYVVTYRNKLENNNFSKKKNICFYQQARVSLLVPFE
jgi:hypothetical protein